VIETNDAATATSAPRKPALARDVAMRLAAHEYDRLVGQLRELSPDEWSRPTVCPAWDVHAMACHVLGMAEFSASVPEQMRQMRAARKKGGLFIDALTALQVDKHLSRSPAGVVARLAEVTPRAAAGRRRTPALVRKITLADQPIEETGTRTEKWRLGYLVDVILTRDTWMHRSDIAAATGRAMSLTADHDGVLVADVVAEWAARHGQPCTITLTGPAGGTWTFEGAGGVGDPAVIQLDAEEFCRILSGRGSGAGLLTTRVPF
jgi:uncharacterized protein (TIGR03083 family)